MTTALLVLAALLVGLLAYRLARLPAALAARATAQALLAKPPSLTQADSPANFPWVASLATWTAATTTVTQAGEPVVDTRGAGDWYDPTVETLPQTFNEYGFITSPSPAPVNPKTGTVPMTNADVCAWIGHAAFSGTCPRCGVPLT